MTGWDIRVVLHPLSLYGSTYSVQVAMPEYDQNCVVGVLNKCKTKKNKQSGIFRVVLKVELWVKGIVIEVLLE